MNNEAGIRACLEKSRARRGLVMTDIEWASIVRAVDQAPPLTDAALDHLAALLRPVVPPLTPVADTPSTRRHPRPHPRSRRRAGRAA
jgi:hypothetical protein